MSGTMRALNNLDSPYVSSRCSNKLLSYPAWDQFTLSYVNLSPSILERSPAGFSEMASRAVQTSGRAAIHSSKVTSEPVRAAVSR